MAKAQAVDAAVAGGMSAGCPGRGRFIVGEAILPGPGRS